MYTLFQFCFSCDLMKTICDQIVVTIWQNDRMMLNYAAQMAKCSCGNLPKSSEIQRSTISCGDSLRFGNFTIRDRKSDKTTAYKEKSIYNLGIPKHVKLIHIRKHHFASVVLNKNAFFTTPISREVVKKEGLLGHVDYFENHT